MNTESFTKPHKNTQHEQVNRSIRTKQQISNSVKIMKQSLPHSACLAWLTKYLTTPFSVSSSFLFFSFKDFSLGRGTGPLSISAQRRAVPVLLQYTAHFGVCTCTVHMQMINTHQHTNLLNFFNFSEHPHVVLGSEDCFSDSRTLLLVLPDKEEEDQFTHIVTTHAHTHTLAHTHSHTYNHRQLSHTKCMKVEKIHG